MKWDWMVFPGSSLGLQLFFDVIAPLLIVVLFRTPRYYTGEAQGPFWQRLWKYLLGGLYAWFFAATVWDFFLKTDR
jgi:hypothetical protein